VINTAPRPTSTATRTAPRCISTGKAARGASGGAAAVQSVRMPRMLVGGVGVRPKDALRDKFA
jgi:hypothetical protein